MSTLCNDFHLSGLDLHVQEGDVEPKELHGMLKTEHADVLLIRVGTLRPFSSPQMLAKAPDFVVSVPQINAGEHDRAM